MKKIYLGIVILLAAVFFQTKRIIAVTYPEARIIDTNKYKEFPEYDVNDYIIENQLLVFSITLPSNCSENDKTMIFAPTEKSGVTERLYRLSVVFLDLSGNIQEKEIIRNINPVNHELNYREGFERYYNGKNYGVKFSIFDLGINANYQWAKLKYIIQDGHREHKTIEDFYYPLYLGYFSQSWSIFGPAVLYFRHNETITKAKIAEEFSASIIPEYYDITGDVIIFSGSPYVGEFFLTFAFFNTFREKKEMNFKVIIEKKIHYMPDGMLFTDIDKPYTMSQIMNYITAQDKEDGNLTDKIKILEDQYSANKDTLGTYKLTLSVTDSILNETNLTIWIKVVDITPPIFSGKADYTMYKSDGIMLTTDMIKEKLQAIDNTEGDISKSISVNEDNFNNKSTTPGDYKIKFSVTDKSGNEGNMTVSVKIIDDEYPEIKFSGLIITLAIGEKMTLQEIKNHISNYLALNNVVANNLQILENQYTGNEEVPGSYIIKISYENLLGETQEKNIKIIIEGNKEGNFFTENKEIIYATCAIAFISLIGFFIKKKFF